MQEYNKQQQAGGSTLTEPHYCYAWINMLELLVTDDMGLGEEYGDLSCWRPSAFGS